VVRHVDGVLAAFRVHPASLTSTKLATTGAEEVRRLRDRYVRLDVGARLELAVNDLRFKLLNWRALAIKTARAVRGRT
jgi:hypothetical protein